MLIDLIRNKEIEDILKEVDRNQDRFAYIPTGISNGDKNHVMGQCLEKFRKVCSERGIIISNIPDLDPIDAITYKSECGVKSIWVSYFNKYYKKSYQIFWKNEFQANKIPWIDGNIYHIDHSFNSARLLAQVGDLNGEPGSKAELSVQNVDYIRLFCLPADLNMAWGRTIERKVSAQKLPGGWFRLGSWLGPVRP